MRKATNDTALHIKRILLIALLVVDAGILVVAVLIFGLPFIEYRQTIRTMESGQYEQAITAFSDMGDYLDSEAYLLESRYLLAQRTLKDGAYAQAQSMFTELGGYQDSPEMVCQCRYLIALQKKEAGNYLEALEMFTALDGYNDSPEMVCQCRYHIALQKKDAGNYPEALEIFTDLGAYQDSADMAVECKYLLACNMMLTKDFQNALALFEALPDYKDSAQNVTECQYQLAIRMINEGKIPDAYAQLTALGDYKESKSYLTSVEDTYELIQAKPNIFVDHFWNEEHGTRVWITTKVIDENTLQITIDGSNGADDHSTQELIGVWDEASGHVNFSGRSYRTLMGSTYCENENFTGYLYYKNRRLHLVVDGDPWGSVYAFY